MRRALLVLLPLFWCSVVGAQGLYDRKRPELFPTDGKMQRSGFYVAPGITYTLTRFKDVEEDYTTVPDTTYSAIFHPDGRIGLYLEVGWFLSTRDPVIIDYWDFGLAYKQLKGKESFLGTFSYGDSIRSWEGHGVFSDNYLTGHVNANRLWQVGDYEFVQFTLGANVDWRFGGSRSYDGLVLPGTQAFPPDILTQVHFKLGYGFKVTQKLMIIPAIETPVFSFVPEDHGFGQVQWFSSFYRPMILSVRFLFLRSPKGWACPPVKNNSEEQRRVKEYKPDSYHP